MKALARVLIHHTQLADVAPVTMKLSVGAGLSARRTLFDTSDNINFNPA